LLRIGQRIGVCRDPIGQNLQELRDALLIGKHPRLYFHLGEPNN